MDQFLVLFVVLQAFVASAVVHAMKEMHLARKEIQRKMERQEPQPKCNPKSQEIPAAVACQSVLESRLLEFFSV